MTTPNPGEREAHEAAELARAALTELGVTGSELATLGVRLDAAGHPLVHLPPLSVASMHRLLAALAPALGPQFLGRRDAAPTPPGRTA